MIAPRTDPYERVHAYGSYLGCLAAKRLGDKGAELGGMESSVLATGLTAARVSLRSGCDDLDDGGIGKRGQNGREKSAGAAVTRWPSTGAARSGLKGAVVQSDWVSNACALSAR